MFQNNNFKQGTIRTSTVTMSHVTVQSHVLSHVLNSKIDQEQTLTNRHTCNVLLQPVHSISRLVRAKPNFGQGPKLCQNLVKRFELWRFLENCQFLNFFSTNILFRRSQISQKIRSGMIFLLFLCQKMCKLLEKLLEYVLMLLKLSMILLPISGFGNQTQNQTNLIASNPHHDHQPLKQRNSRVKFHYIKQYNPTLTVQMTPF